MAGMREDIQSLRAIAVFFVLVFHLWDEQISGGYLGVDVFFIISGYIMCMLLSKVAPLDSSKILLFYFRRIKRIVPLYLFLIIVVLFIGLFLVAPAEYHLLFLEGWSSAIFCSNFIESNPEGYFMMRRQFSYFKHTWSLSAEIQFYIAVPLLFYLFEWLDNKQKSLKYGAITLIGAISFALQSLLGGDSAHMLLISRMWQFMCGFLTFHLHESGILAVENICMAVGQGREKMKVKIYQNGIKKENEEKIDSIKLENEDNMDCVKLENGVEDKILNDLKEIEHPKSLHSTLSEIIKLLIIFGLLFLLCIESIHNFYEQLHRLGVVLLTMITMAQIKPSYFLGLKPLVALGDCSYSVYLVHWPLFTIHRYWYPEQYAREHDYATFMVGAQLITISIVLGYLMEELFKFGIRWLRNWISLMSVVISMYLVIGMLLGLIINQTPRITHDMLYPDTKILEFEKDFMKLYHENFEKSTFSELNEMNIKMHIHGGEHITCPNGPHKLMTNYTNPIPVTPYICNEEGTGTKNIVLIGNSHARALFFGIKEQFKSVYRHLTLISTRWCMPFYGDHVEEVLQLDMHKRLCPFCRDWIYHCVDYERAQIEALKQWKEPIDVIIVGFAYHPANIPFDPINKMKDDYFSQMQQFYSKLNSIAREAVFIPNTHMLFPITPATQLIQKRLYFNENLDFFDVKERDQIQRLKTIRARIDLIECDKCIKVEWYKTWCFENQTCKMLDEKHLSYFRDWHHVNMHGSMKYGQLLLDLYRNHTQQY